LVKLQALHTAVAHDKDVNSVAVSPNDSLIATGSQDKTVKLWNSKTAALVGVCRGHRRGVWCVEFSPVDLCVLSTSSDHTIKIWSLTDYTCLKTLEGHSNGVLRATFVSAGMQVLSCSSDTLIKLWTLKTSECVNTFDAHTDKVWALSVRQDEQLIATGGSDSLINLWSDVTQLDREQKAEETEQRLLQEQELSNLVREKRYGEAASIAFALDQPFRLLTVLNAILHPPPPRTSPQDAPDASLTPTYVAPISADSTLDDLIGGLTPDQLQQCLKYVRDWNTNARHAHTAQRVLSGVLRKLPPTHLTKLPSIRETLAALLSYSSRHYSRTDRMLQQSFLIDYTANSMSLLFDSHSQPLA